VPDSAFPVAVTADAVEQLRRVLARKGEPGAFVRIGVKGGGCSGLEYVVKIETRRLPGDASLVLDGLEVVCDPKSAEFLAGAELVWTGNLVGGFQFENPNAERSCGCGTSFVPKARGA
jgi:iron-sulfur cluster assembly protein